MYRRGRSSNDFDRATVSLLLFRVVEEDLMKVRIGYVDSPNKKILVICEPKSAAERRKMEILFEATNIASISRRQTLFGNLKLERLCLHLPLREKA